LTFLRKREWLELEVSILVGHSALVMQLTRRGRGQRRHGRRLVLVDRVLVDWLCSLEGLSVLLAQEVF
jgi:hypothetical protein